MRRGLLRSIVLPSYNESGYIAEMVARTLTAGEMRPDPFEVIIVDNASTDDTAAIVAEIAEADPRVRLLRHPENRLYAASCLTGTRAARGERIFVLDSDGQHSPRDIWSFDAKLDEGYDLVFGWRQERHETRQRILLSKVLLSLTRAYTGFPFHDINCGIRGYTRAYAEQLEIRHFLNLINPELYVRARSGGFRMGEVPVIQEKRKAGSSSQEFSRAWIVFRQVNGYLRALRRELRHPPSTAAAAAAGSPTAGAPRSPRRE
jgi:glycosyltransferase involved in cell wall biosynthesis